MQNASKRAPSNLNLEVKTFWEGARPLPRPVLYWGGEHRNKAQQSV